MAIRLTPKELEMRGIVMPPTEEQVESEGESAWLIPGGIDPQTGAIITPSVPSIPEPSAPSVLSIPSAPIEFREEVKYEPQAGITIGATKAELQQIADAKAKGLCVGAMRAYYKIKPYKLKLTSGETILVEALDKGSAKKKAEDKGYIVFSVGRVIGEVKKDVVPAIKEEVSQVTLKDQTLKDFETNLYATAIPFLIEAWESGVGLQQKVNNYNKAVQEYNDVVEQAKEWGSYSRDELITLLNVLGTEQAKKQGLITYLSGSFADKYAEIMKPSGVSDKDYEIIKPFIKPYGFDSEAAFEAGKDNPAKAAQIMWVTNKYVNSFASEDTKDKLKSGQWTLLPYGQVIETKNLEQMPATYRQIVETSGLVGYEDYQDKVLEWNKSQSWVWNTIDAIGAQAVRLGQDIKNFAILESTLLFPDVKEGDSKFKQYLLRPGIYDGVGVIGLGGSIVTTGMGSFTAEEAEAINARNEEIRKVVKEWYDQAELAAQEWHASRPYLQPVYPAGFVDSARQNPEALKDPLLWTETIANTLPYTVATGLIVAGAVGAGPAGVAITAPLAFGITMSVEGHDIYKDAMAHGASHDRALELANIYGSISASIETLGDTIFVGALGIGGGAFSQALGKNLGGNIIRGAAAKYGWKNLTVGMIKDFVNQGGQEFFQEVVHNAAIKTVDENQYLLDNTANAFVSGVIGTAPFVLFPAGGQAIRNLKAGIADLKAGKVDVAMPTDITPQMQLKILNKVFQPVSGFTVKTTEAEIMHFKKAVPEILKTNPVEYLLKLWEMRGRYVREVGRNISVGLIDKKTVITGKDKVNETALAYSGMSAKVNEYAFVQLKLKQALKAISDFGLAKSKSELKILNEYKKRVKELEARLKELKGPMVEAVRNFSEMFLKHSVGLESEQKAEVREMLKTVVADIDSVTSQLFGERTALEIAKDIKELGEQIKVIEGEISKGMTVEQLEGYGRLINILKSQIADLVRELRMRYLGMGEEVDLKTKKLVMEVMSIQARLVKAVNDLDNFGGSALDYDVYRKGELVRGAEVVKLERDTFEAIQKSTEALWGKENYADKLYELNTSLSNLVDIMKEAELSHWRIAGIGFNIYEALRQRQKLKALKKHIQSMATEVDKVKDISLHQRAEAQAQVVEAVAKDLARQTGTSLATKKVKIDPYKLEYTDADFKSARDEGIRREAERIVSERFRKLLDYAPSYVHKRTGRDLMDYLYEIYDAEYFKTVHDGIFKDLDDYLSVENEAARIRMQVEYQEWLQKMDEQIASFEAEANLAGELKDREPGPKRRDSLDRQGDKAKRTADRLKEELKRKQKTKVAVAEREELLSASEKEKLEKIREKVIEEKLQRLKDKVRSEQKAKELIAAAKKELAEKEKVEGELEVKEKEEVLSDVIAKTQERVQTRYKEEVRPKEQVFTKTALATATQVAVQTYARTQTEGATQTQTQTAIETATQTALKEELETATEQEITTATRIITEIVTRITTQLVILIPPPPILVTSNGKKYYKIPKGSIAWRQGSLKVKGKLRPHWKYITAPWTQQKPISLDYPPMGALRIGETTPEKTIQMIGKPKAKVPKDVSVDLGVVDIRISDYGQKIEFTGRGLETVVGKSLSAPTKGMSIPAMAPMYVRKTKIKKRKNGKRERVKTKPTLSTAR